MLRIAHEFGRFPHEVMALPEFEFDLMVAYFILSREEDGRA